MCLLTVPAAPVAALRVGRARGFPWLAGEEAKRAGNVNVPRGSFWICVARHRKGLAAKEIGKALWGKEQEKADKQKTLDLLDKFNA